MSPGPVASVLIAGGSVLHEKAHGPGLPGLGVTHDGLFVSFCVSRTSIPRKQRLRPLPPGAPTPCRLPGLCHKGPGTQGHGPQAVTSPSSRGPQGWLLLGLPVSIFSIWVLMSSSRKDPCLTGLGPTHLISCPLRRCPQTQARSEVPGVRTPAHDSGGGAHTSQPISLQRSEMLPPRCCCKGILKQRNQIR